MFCSWSNAFSVYRFWVLTLIVSAALPLGGCATTEERADGFPHAARVQAPTVGTSTSAQPLTDLVQSLYAPGLKAPIALLRTQVAALAQDHPNAWEVHEVQAYLARLDGNERVAWHHFLSAAADLRARDALLYLDEGLAFSRSRSELTAEVQVLRGLAGRHPQPDVRDAARTYLISDLRELGKLNEAEQVLRGLEHLNQWQMLGAFDNDQGKGFLTVYPPEEALDFSAEVQGARVPIRWRTVPRLSPWGEVPLLDMVSPAKWSIAYLATWVFVPTSTDAELRVSTGDPLRAWINQRLVIDRSRVRAYGPDNLTTSVRLQKGWNQVLLKTAQETGSWTVRARITAPGGAAIAGLKQSVEPHPSRRDNDNTLPALHIFPYSADHAGKEGNPRRSFLKERYLSTHGRYREGLEAAQAFHQLAPGSRMAQRRLIIMLDVNQESGAAIDLLNRVIDETKGDLGWFPRRRARFFKGKKQYDRAQNDLMKLLEKHPNLVRARMDLAGVFKARGFAIDRCQTIGQVLNDYPDSAWVVREKADCLSARGFTEQGFALYEIADRLEPGDAITIGRLLDRRLTTGRYDDAETYARRLLALRPTSVSSRLKVSWLAWLKGDLTRAAGLAQEAIALDPDDSRPHRRLGNLAYEQGEKKAALSHWENALARAPNNNTLANLVDHVSSEGPGMLEELAPTERQIEAAIAVGRGAPAPAGTWIQLLLDHEVTEIKNDGSARALVTLIRQAVSKQGQDALIRSRIPSSRTKLLRAYSITPQGVRQEASSIRGGTIRFRKPEIGTITVVQYLTHRGKGAFLPNHFVSSWFFQGVHRAYRDSTWVVLTPKGRKLTAKVHGDVKQTRSTRGNYDVRTFHSENAPPLIPERGMPPGGDVLWRVHLTTVENWDEYVRWERALLDNAFRSNAQLEALAIKLTDGIDDPRQKFDRLFHYVAQEIRYQQDYENTIAGVRPHSCPVVLERGYGDCKDKAVLLILLAQRVGVDVDFAILRTSGAGTVERDIPNQQFNHAIVYVPKQTGIADGFFMDPTTDGLDMGNLRADDQGATSLVLDPDSGKWAFHDIPWQDPKFESTRYEIALKLAPGGTASATIAGRMRGSLASSARKALRDSESSKRLFDGLSGIFFSGATSTSGQAEGDSEDIYKALEITIEADASGAVHEESDGTRIDLPLLFPLVAGARLKERKLPLKLGINRVLEVQIDIASKGRKRLRLPDDFKVEHPCFTFVRKTVSTANLVSVTTRFEQSCHEVAPSEYPEFRAAAQEVIAHARDTITLGR